jgi:hypothetical protein
VEGFLLERYDPHVFSENEKKRFTAGLGDGLGYRHRPHRDEHFEDLALSAVVAAGLLKHRAHYDMSVPSEYQGEDRTEEFWEKPEEYLGPGLFQQCPINFDSLAIGLYFL